MTEFNNSCCGNEDQRGHSHGAHAHGEHCGRGRAGHGAAFHHGPFGRRGMKGGPFGAGGPHAQAFAAFMGHGGRARRGDVRAAVLRLLSEQPMHGYQIIQELSTRSEGSWSPSAGSVYPTLQLLADEGLVTAEETGGKKVFSLTEAGTAEVAKTAGEAAPWEDSSADTTTAAGAYRAATGKLMQAVFQIGTGGTSEQIEAATEIVTEARKKLYALLAED
ncbi:MAG TPA: PadR family transcriptional regulator [Coriobacteriia bacterium]|nr:PadR family transcriptional regulator [Coriobacteriia bacterium]